MSIDFVKFAHESDLQNQRDLFQLCFPENNGTNILSKDHYMWKFQSFPNDKQSSFEYTALNANQLVGYYAAIPFRYSINGDTLTAGMVCDVMTHPDMRGRGIFTRLGTYATDQLKNEGLHFTTGYPIRKEVIPGHIKVGWKIAFDLPLLLKPLKANSILKEKGIGFFSPIFNVFISFYSNILKMLFLKNDCDITTSMTPFENFMGWDQYESFFRKWSTEHPHHLIKDRKFLKWRLSASGTKYNFVSLKHKDQLVGLAITREHTLEGIPTVAILDFMILSEYIDHAPRLIEEISCSSKTAEAVVVMISKEKAKKYKFYHACFLKTPFCFKLIIKILNLDPGDNFLKEKNWCLMWIDSDDL